MNVVRRVDRTFPEQRGLRQEAPTHPRIHGVTQVVVEAVVGAVEEVEDEVVAEPDLKRAARRGVGQFGGGGVVVAVEGLRRQQRAIGAGGTLGARLDGAEEVVREDELPRATREELEAEVTLDAKVAQVASIVRCPCFHQSCPRFSHTRQKVSIPIHIRFPLFSFSTN